MTYDPLSEIIDEPLTVDARVTEQLRDYRLASKLTHLPGIDVTEERERLEKNLDNLVDRLLEGIEKNPTKRWVLAQFQPSLEAVEYEDTEGREHFGMEIELIMDILGIDSSDGLLTHYLGGM
ncbi:DUF4844 domain-containing protein [Massilia sp. YIM B02443]|uniref:DUF4844 domain-containing protein n=1 Tax=Massilia sp. YIM B02443 TaxID=3050127 RepID=UPI0025B7349A|nr:DUF4844 domain-containing protein [Massilia sp. YIM B02443]MDN4036514.1 DUF4844 domain-containing protein [Massilia sp. YIM B02443]